MDTVLHGSCNAVSQTLLSLDRRDKNWFFSLHPVALGWLFVDFNQGRWKMNQAEIRDRDPQVQSHSLPGQRQRGFSPSTIHGSCPCSILKITFVLGTGHPTEMRFLKFSNITSQYKVLWSQSSSCHSSGVKSTATSWSVIDPLMLIISAALAYSIISYEPSLDFLKFQPALQDVQEILPALSNLHWKICRFTKRSCQPFTATPPAPTLSWRSR